jgi:hypothetical protein
MPRSAKDSGGVRNEMGHLALIRGWRRGGARGGGRGAASVNLRVPTASAPTAAVVAGAGKADKMNEGQKVTQLSNEDLKICKDNQVCRIHVTEILRGNTGGSTRRQMSARKWD